MDNKKKILLIVVNEPKFLLSHRLDLALAAKELGFDVHIASANENEAVKIRELGFSFHPFYIAKYGKNPFQDAVTFFQLLRLYHKIQPTILHHVTIKPVIYGSFAARFVPSVRGVVNAIPGLGYLFSRANFETSLEGRIVLMMYKAALGLDNSVVITQNPDDEAMLLKLNLAKATQIEIISGSGVDDALFTPANRELVSENCRVAFVGRLLHQKGIVEFVAAANSLVVLGIKATFVVAGDIPVGNPGAIENSLLQEWIEQGVVEFVGHCKDMPSFYEGVDVVCLPSYGEGFPKVLVEALACGKAIISTDVAGCREVVRPGLNGTLVPARSVEALAIAMKELIESPQRCRDYGSESRKLFLVSEMSLNSVIKKHLEIYNQLIAN